MFVGLTFGRRLTIIRSSQAAELIVTDRDESKVAVLNARPKQLMANNSEPLGEMEYVLGKAEGKDGLED